MSLKNLGSLITTTQPDGKEGCLGYLFNFRGHGVFSPDGKTEITPGQAETHNRLLAEAEIKGLEENCQVGQRGTFYFKREDAHRGKVTTWTGAVVSTHAWVNGQVITFWRGNKEFRGRLCKDADCFNFKRVR